MSDQQYSHKCSKRMTVTEPEVYPSHLIDENISGSSKQLTRHKTNCTLTCSYMMWGIYETHSEMVTLIIRECHVLL